MKKSGFLITAIFLVGLAIPALSITIGLGDFYVNVGDYDYLPYNYVSAPQYAPQSINFYDVMGQYGNWITSPQFGRVWQPYSAQGWRPYLYGHWLNTQYGPTWEGYEPWAWAGYHYGDWAYTRDAGWVWIPGYDWHPGRVSWAQGMGSIGWMPQPPSGYDYSRGYLAPAGPSNQFDYYDNDFGNTGNDYTYGGPYYNPQYREAYYNPNYLQSVGNLWTFIDPSGFTSDDYADYYLGPDYTRMAFDQRVVRVNNRPISMNTIEQIVRQPIQQTAVEVKEIQTDKKPIKIVVPTSSDAVQNVRKNSNRVVREIVAPAFAEKQKDFKGQNSKQAQAINKIFNQENQPAKTENVDNQQIQKQAQDERQARQARRQQREEAAKQKLAKAKSERKMKEPATPNAQMQPRPNNPQVRPPEQPNAQPLPGRPEVQQQTPEERSREQNPREQAREPRAQPDQPNEREQPNRQQEMPGKNDDTRITQIVQQRISNAQMLNDASIHAQAKDGEVVLHGTVNNKQQENRAVELARSVNGVRNVRSELVIKKKGNAPSH